MIPNNLERYLNPIPIGILLVTIGLLSSPILLLLNNPYVYVYIPAVLAGGAGVLLTEFREESTPAISVELPRLIHLYAALSVLLATAILYSASRTIPIHVLTILLYSVAVVAILAEVRWDVSLVGVLATAIVHRATIVFSSPLLLGNDTLEHNRLAREIHEVGSIEPLAAGLTKYFYAPVYHLLVGITRTITGADIQLSAFLIVTVPSVVVIGLAVFKMATRYTTSPPANFAVLLIVAADQTIRFGVQPQPTSLGLIFFPLTLYVFFRYLNLEDRRLGLLVLCLFGTLILTHQVSSALTVTILSLIVLGRTIYRISAEDRGVGI